MSTVGFALPPNRREGERGAPDHPHGSPHVPYPRSPGMGLHFDSGGREELADLGGMLKT